MNITFPLRGALAALALCTVLGLPLAAQNVLYADHQGKLYPVLKARDSKPYIKLDGKLVAADGRRFALSKGKEYLPVFVALERIEVSTSYMDMEGSQINRAFHFSATLQSPYSLDDVFIVLELATDAAGRMIYLQEVGQLQARVPRSVSVHVPMSFELGSGHYVLHLFSEGVELLHSEIPAMQRDEVVDQMIAQRLPAGPDSAPQIYIGPEPEYPPALLKTKTTGKVVIALRIGANGRVYDPAVKTASDPAFGEAALKAVRLWRFIPRLKNGRAVDTQVELPLNFAPPVKPVGSP